MQQVTVICTLTVEDLQQRGACRDALDWLEAEGHTDLVVAWQDCPRADWMLWLLAALDVDHRLLVQIACALVRRTPLVDGRTVWDLLTDERARQAVEAAERWGAGTVTDGEIIAAAAANATVYAAAYADAAAADGVYAVDAVAVSLADATAAAYATAVNAVDAAAYATAVADAADTRAAQADMVREYVTLVNHA